jgi:pimeloyl-ACP methyl ester carboxylesterase
MGYRHRSIVCVGGIGAPTGEWDGLRSGLDGLGHVVPAIPRRDRLVLVGHSEGGVRVLEVAGAQPDRVDAVVLTSSFFPPARAGRSFTATLVDYGRHRVRYVRAVAVRGRRPRPTRQAVGQIAGVARLGLRPGRFHDLAAAVTCPVLVVHGSDDDVVPVAFARAATARHENWALVVLDGAGHRPHADQPEAWTETVRDWLSATLGPPISGAGRSTVD